jgi:transcriptional regulator with XRE-family HTH domain
MNPVDKIILRAKGQGITMTALCAEAGVHPAQVSRWRKGRVRPLYDSVLALEEALERLTAPAETPEAALLQAAAAQTLTS